MKLHVLGICDPRAGAMGHRQAVATRADRIRRVAIDSSETASRENRCTREITMHSLLGAIEDVTTVTGNLAIVVEWISRVMRKRDQVDRSRV